MTLPELVPEVRSLPRADKIRLMQVLAEALASDEGVSLFEPGQIYPVWSPYDSYDAAVTLMQLLAAEKSQP